MIKPLSFYVDKIINDLKEKGKQSKQKGWAMSDIVQEVENQLGKDASALARKRIINNYNDSIDSILLACTELPIVIKENSFEGKKVISSIDEYINYLI